MKLPTGDKCCSNDCKSMEELFDNHIAEGDEETRIAYDKRCCNNDCKTPQEMLDNHLPNDCFPPVIVTEILPSTGTTTSENILGKNKRWWEFWK